jgi:nucleotide-binding universal stress UspA family protein
MRDIRSAPSVVVGIDGSPAASEAAVWAVDEAVSRDIPLRLLYVVEWGDLCDADADHVLFAAARVALYEAQGAVEATGQPVKIETAILVGKPVAKLAAESRSAVMVCIGSMGTKHVSHGGRSVASVLPTVAQCPVAVIHRPGRRRVAREVGGIVVEADNGVVLRHAFEEARLRGAALQVISSWRAEIPEDIAEGNRRVQARLNRQIASWTRLYPDVKVEPVAVLGDVCQYLADSIGAVQLFVVGAQRSRCDSESLSRLDCSVLTVGRNHL